MKKKSKIAKVFPLPAEKINIGGNMNVVTLVICKEKDIVSICKVTESVAVKTMQKWKNSKLELVILR